MYINEKEVEQTRQIVLKLQGFCELLIEKIANGDKTKEMDLINQLIEHMLKPLDESDIWKENNDQQTT